LENRPRRNRGHTCKRDNRRLQRAVLKTKGKVENNEKKRVPVGERVTGKTEKRKPWDLTEGGGTVTKGGSGTERKGVE